MFRLLIWLLLAYVGFRILKALAVPKQPAKGPVAQGEETVQDPVCGTYLARSAAVVGTYEGNRHYFCSMDCLEKFRDQLNHTQHN